MKPYRIKHVPTGLYYKPGKANLSKNGKVYTTGVNVLNYYTHGSIPVSAHTNSKLHTSTKDIIQWKKPLDDPYLVSASIPRNEFIIEEI